MALKLSLQKNLRTWAKCSCIFRHRVHAPNSPQKIFIVRWNLANWVSLVCIPMILVSELWPELFTTLKYNTLEFSNSSPNVSKHLLQTRFRDSWMAQSGTVTATIFLVPLLFLHSLQQRSNQLKVTGIWSTVSVSEAGLSWWADPAVQRSLQCIPAREPSRGAVTEKKGPRPSSPQSHTPTTTQNTRKSLC